MRHNVLMITWKILRTVFFIIGLLWCVVSLSWYEPRNYKVFFLPKMKSYVCVRLVDSGYKNIERYIDITFGDTVESVTESDPWHSDIIRLSGKRWIQDYFAIREGDNDTIFFVGHDDYQLFLRKGNKSFVYMSPIDEHRIVQQGGFAAAANHISYQFQTSSKLMIKNFKIISLNGDEEVSEIPLRRRIFRE